MYERLLYIVDCVNAPHQIHSLQMPCDGRGERGDPGDVGQKAITWEYLGTDWTFWVNKKIERNFGKTAGDGGVIEAVHACR